MIKSCTNCNGTFEVTDVERALKEKISPVFNGVRYEIPESILCPTCKQQRRMAWRNERNLYKRTCDGSGKQIVAAYPPDTSFPVYDREYWWSDAYDPTKYGREIDFDKPFFEQLGELVQSAPRLNLSNSHNENCDYVNYTNYSKDCYLIYGNHQSEKCCHCWRVHHCLYCFDCTQLDQCQYCYECTDCSECYNVTHSRNSHVCSDSSYLVDCRNCKNCLFCCNLANAEYCIMNEKVSPEEYEARKNELQENFEEFVSSLPKRSSELVQCEDCTGDYLVKCKDCIDCYSANESRDCLRLYLGERTTDCIDCDITGWPAELCYDSISAGVEAHLNRWISTCWSCKDSLYCDTCFHSHHLFGCVAMKNNAYCILNKQYTEEEYNDLASKLIEHMKATNEWGVFMPIEHSPFPYNETVAFENWPVTKEEVERNGWQWREQDDTIPDVKKTIPADKLPSNIEDVPDDILNWAIVCRKTERPFKIVKQELDFYRQMNLPIPHLHPDQRHHHRMNLRNPRVQHERECSNCEQIISTTYSSEFKGKVLCEECYLSTVY